MELTARNVPSSAIIISVKKGSQWKNGSDSSINAIGPNGWAEVTHSTPWAGHSNSSCTCFVSFSHSSAHLFCSFFSLLHSTFVVLSFCFFLPFPPGFGVGLSLKSVAHFVKPLLARWQQVPPGLNSMARLGFRLPETLDSSLISRQNSRKLRGQFKQRNRQIEGPSCPVIRTQHNFRMGKSKAQIQSPFSLIFWIVELAREKTVQCPISSNESHLPSRIKKEHAEVMMRQCVPVLTKKRLLAMVAL